MCVCVCVLVCSPMNQVTQKMVLDASKFNTQNYKVWIKDKWDKERGSSVLPNTLV